MSKVEKEFISFEIETDLKARFQEKVKAEDRTVSSKLRLLVKEYLGEIEQADI